jgi:hypothetical protein
LQAYKIQNTPEMDLLNRVENFAQKKYNEKDNGNTNIHTTNINIRPDNNPFKDDSIIKFH